MDIGIVPSDETAPALVYTKAVRAVFLAASRLALRFRTTTSWGEGIVQVECFREESRKGQSTTVAVSLGCFEARAFIGNGHLDELYTVPASGCFGSYEAPSVESSNTYAPKRGFWGLSYFNQPTHERAVFKLLPLGSALTFRVRLDYATNAAMARKGIHGDLLEVEAVKGKQQYNLTLDTQTGPHNSARFGAWEVR